MLDVARVSDAQHNVALGCQAFTVWENAQGEPRYWIFHCPDEATALAAHDGLWLTREDWHAVQRELAMGRALREAEAR